MDSVTSGVLGLLFGGHVIVLFLAVRRRNVAASVNTIVALGAALLSLLLVTEFQSPGAPVATAAVLPTWVGAAGLIHSAGMLGPYESIWWWDHLTHTVTAALVAALLYAGILVASGDGTPPAVSSLPVAALTVGFTLLLGTFWELVELGARAVGERYDVEPVLVHYGWRDTALDLAFDLAGAVLVVALDVRVFVEFAAGFPAVARRLLVWTGGIVLAGSIVLGLVLPRGTRHDTVRE